MANHEYAACYIQDNEGCSVVAEFIVQGESAAKALQCCNQAVEPQME